MSHPLLIVLPCETSAGESGTNLVLISFDANTCLWMLGGAAHGMAGA
jgi:hypothetical protein